MEGRISKSKEQHKLVLEQHVIDEIVERLKAERVASAITEEEVKRIVEAKIEAFAADGINQTDHALASGGASIVSQLTSSSYYVNLFDWLWSREHKATVILRVFLPLRLKRLLTHPYSRATLLVNAGRSQAPRVM